MLEIWVFSGFSLDFYEVIAYWSQSSGVKAGGDVVEPRPTGLEDGCSSQVPTPQWEIPIYALGNLRVVFHHFHLPYLLLLLLLPLFLLLLLLKKLIILRHWRFLKSTAQIALQGNFTSYMGATYLSQELLFREWLSYLILKKVRFSD